MNTYIILLLQLGLGYILFLKLKFILDRKSLEIIYTSFIRPIYEYADVVWDNCTQYEINAVEKIQTEAAKIVTGTSTLVSLEKLYNKTCRETLEQRRQKHKLSYLTKCLIILRPIISPLSFLLLSKDYEMRPTTRTQLYYKSFLPSSIRSWNELSPEIRDSNSVQSFR